MERLIAFLTTPSWWHVGLAWLLCGAVVAVVFGAAACAGKKERKHD